MENKHYWRTEKAYAGRVLESLGLALRSVTRGEWFAVRHHFEAYELWGNLLVSEKAIPSLGLEKR